MAGWLSGDAIRVTWEAPADDGGAPVTDYRVTVYDAAGNANMVERLIESNPNGVQSGVTFHGGNSQYTTGGAAEAARNSLINNRGWTITDGGAAP